MWETIQPYLEIISNTLIILLTFSWFLFKIFTSEWVKSKLGIKTHKANLLNEYKLKRYDNVVDEIEKIITKSLPDEFKALNIVYAKMVLSASDKTLRGFLKETKTKLDKETRNKIYYYLRKELQPKSKLKLSEIQNILYADAKDVVDK